MRFNCVRSSYDITCCFSKARCTRSQSMLGYWAWSFAERVTFSRTRPFQWYSGVAFAAGNTGSFKI